MICPAGVGAKSPPATRPPRTAPRPRSHRCDAATRDVRPLHAPLSFQRGMWEDVLSRSLPAGTLRFASARAAVGRPVASRALAGCVAHRRGGRTSPPPLRASSSPAGHAAWPACAAPSQASGDPVPGGGARGWGGGGEGTQGCAGPRGVRSHGNASIGAARDPCVPDGTRQERFSVVTPLVQLLTVRCRTHHSVVLGAISHCSRAVTHTTPATEIPQNIHAREKGVLFMEPCGGTPWESKG